QAPLLLHWERALHSLSAGFMLRRIQRRVPCRQRRQAACLINLSSAFRLTLSPFSMKALRRCWTFSYGTGITGRQLKGHPFPDHGVLQDQDFSKGHGGVYATPHLQYYKDTALKP